MVSRRIIEGPIVKVGTRSGNGGHVIIPEHWIGKKLGVVSLRKQKAIIIVIVTTKLSSINHMQQTKP